MKAGSQDGFIKLWRVRKDYKRIEPLFPIPMTGFVNSLDFSPDGRFLTVAVGQEHRLGRWWKLTSARNQVVIILLNKRSSETNKDDNNNQDK
jgi:ribosomal RNA-processing protein 9